MGTATFPLIVCAVLGWQVSVSSVSGTAIEFDQENFFVVVGQSASLECRAKRGQNIRFSDFKLYIRGREVDASLISPTANNKGVVLHYSNITGDDNLDFDLNKGNIIECQVANRGLSIYISVIVGYAPFQPRITSQYIQNWENLIFNWNTAKKNEVFLTHYTAWFRRSDSEYEVCRREVDQQCTLSLRSNDTIWCVKVNATNRGGNATSEEVCLYEHNVTVIPGVIRDLDVSADSNGDVTLTFRSPHYKPGFTYEYNISSSCNGRTFNHQALEASEVVTKTMRLPPHAYCNITVQARSARSRLEYGWGPPAMRSILTYASVPSAVPETCSNCFEINHLNPPMATIYAKPLSLEKARGVIAGYRITACGNNNKTIPATADMTYFNVTLPIGFTSCRVQFEPGTKFPHNDTVRFNDTLEPAAVTLLASANMPQPSYNITAIILNSSVRLYWNRFQSAKLITVFWKRVISPAKSFIDWIELSSNVTEYTVALSPSEHISNYRFGVGFESVDHVTSGIHWSNVYSSTEEPGACSVELLKAEEGKLYLRLKRKEFLSPTGYVYGYKIHYCSSQTHSACKVKQIDSLQVDVTLDELHETEYTVEVESLSASRHRRNAKQTFKLPSTQASSGLASIIITATIILVVCLLIPVLVKYRRKLFIPFKRIAISPPSGADSPSEGRSSTYEDETGSLLHGRSTRRSISNSDRASNRQTVKQSSIFVNKMYDTSHDNDNSSQLMQSTADSQGMKSSVSELEVSPDVGRNVDPLDSAVRSNTSSVHTHLGAGMNEGSPELEGPPKPIIAAVFNNETSDNSSSMPFTTHNASTSNSAPLSSYQGAVSVLDTPELEGPPKPIIAEFNNETSDKSSSMPFTTHITSTSNSAPLSSYQGAVSVLDTPELEGPPKPIIAEFNNETSDNSSSMPFTTHNASTSNSAPLSSYQGAVSVLDTPELEGPPKPIIAEFNNETSDNSSSMPFTTHNASTSNSAPLSSYQGAVSVLDTPELEGPPKPIIAEFNNETSDNSSSMPFTTHNASTSNSAPLSSYQGAVSVLDTAELEGPPKPICVECDDRTGDESTSHDMKDVRSSTKMLSNASSGFSGSPVQSTRLEIPCDDVVNQFVEENSGDSFDSYSRVTSENNNVNDVPATEPIPSTISSEDVDEEQAGEVNAGDVNSQSGGSEDDYSTVAELTRDTDITSGGSASYTAAGAKLLMFSVPEGKPSQPVFN